MNLPWIERVPMLSINPDAASRDDIAQLASELMDSTAENKRLKQVDEQLLITIKELKDERTFLTSQVNKHEAENKRLREALRDLIFTASKLWDDTPKPIMSGGAIIVTHPIIEQAKQALAENP